MTLPRATAIGHAHPGTDHVALDYEGRLLRRKRLVSAGGRAFLVDLPETVSLSDGDAFRLDDGTEVAVRAAPEPLIEVTGDLPRLAWHIGNRHTPCRIEADRLLIRRDHVLAACSASSARAARDRGAVRARRRRLRPRADLRARPRPRT
jgi:urease accessory protein